MFFSACLLTDPNISSTPPPLTEDGRTLLSSILGRWQISANETGNCDSTWRIRFPSGRTVWEESAEGLEISALGEGDSLRLYPVNDNELESVVSIEYLSCQGVVNNRLYIDELEPRMMSALFTQEMTIVGGTAWTPQLPVQPCRHTTAIQAIRN